MSQSPERRQLLLVINEDRFFLSHRKEVALGAMSRGWEVTLLAKDTGRRAEVEALGVRFVEMPVNPTGMNPLQELRTLRFLTGYYRRHRHVVAHHVGLKSIVWGGVAARLARIGGVVDAVSGLGTLFSNESPTMTTRILSSIIKWGMKKRNVKVIFQNHDDERLFVEGGIVDGTSVNMIKGSGVDLKEFAYTPEPSERPLTVIFTARMLKEKGVTDLIDAAELLRGHREGEARFLLCGGLSKNPKALSEDYLRTHCDGRYIVWAGHRTDVHDLLQQSAIMAFPSYYREGVPKSLIEASAIGRPIVTTDSIGCRDTVEDGVNGFLVAPRSPRDLAEKIDMLLGDPDLRKRMGLKSREIAERDYDVRHVVDEHLRIYEEVYSKI